MIKLIVLCWNIYGSKLVCTAPFWGLRARLWYHREKNVLSVNAIWARNTKYNIYLQNAWIWIPGLDIIYQFIRPTKGASTVHACVLGIILWLGFVPKISCEPIICGSNFIHCCKICTWNYTRPLCDIISTKAVKYRRFRNWVKYSSLSLILFQIFQHLRYWLTISIIRLIRLRHVYGYSFLFSL